MKALNILLITAAAVVFSSCASTAPRSKGCTSCASASKAAHVPVNTKLNDPGRATYMQVGR